MPIRVKVYASAVYDQNKYLKSSGLEPINLKSVIIGNGYTDPLSMLISYYDISCTTASVEPFIDVRTCVRMKTALPRCEAMLRDSCLNTFDAIGCGVADLFCNSEISDPVFQSGRNVYDVSKECDGSRSIPQCYPILKTISEYLDQPEIRKLLGVSSSLQNMSFTSCNHDISNAFNRALDQYQMQTPYYIEGLLDRGVKVLIYVGVYDWGCNWVGNLRMVNALDWSGKSMFRQQKLRPWRMKKEESGEIAGNVKAANGLTFLTIEGAGHMVPYDKPREALEMLKRWIAGDPF